MSGAQEGLLGAWAGHLYALATTGDGRVRTYDTGKSCCRRPLPSRGRPSPPQIAESFRLARSDGPAEKPDIAYVWCGTHIRHGGTSRSCERAPRRQPSVPGVAGGRGERPGGDPRYNAESASNQLVAHPAHPRPRAAAGVGGSRPQRHPCNDERPGGRHRSRRCAGLRLRHWRPDMAG
jgi:hypothetical protein